jgi:hypothetical protein
MSVDDMSEREINEALLRMSMADPDWDGQGKSMYEEAQGSMRAVAYALLAWLLLVIVVAAIVIIT